jgi:3-methylcrotonyl-CoA carboxylase alpha subunit
LKNENPDGQNNSLMKLLNKILVANRGEIAVRIIRTLRMMGIRSVAIYSSRDKNALHVRMADEAYDLGGNELKETYLDSSKIVHIAQQSGADGIHPGYGFLSENAGFAKAVADAGINFIGPTPEVIQLMGDKIMARKTMRDIKIPMIEGFEGSIKEILKRSKELAFPILVKAAAGGGGKAMRIVHEFSALNEILEGSSREAQNYFGNGRLFVERYLPDARHIEVQILSDHYGNYLILGERECSVQRRYQKVIEESPSLSISQKTREAIYLSANKIARKIGYNNAGTLEFLVDKSGNHFFLEMNTRIQVEHAITEMVTGLDIVELQIQIAAGNQLLLKQSDIHISGHAIEARVYAEDPEKDYMPSPGKIELYHEPQMPGLRIDSGLDGPDILHPEYDPLIAKVIFHGQSRDEAIDGLNMALKNYILHGPKTNREFIREILAEPDFRKNKISTLYLGKITEKLNKNINRKKAEFQKNRIFAAWLGWNLNSHPVNENSSIWTQIGFWRMLPRKSILFESSQVDIYIETITGNTVRFSIDGENHEMNLKSHSPESIIFELDGIWSSASVSRAYSYEDIVCVEGMEFKIRPLDYLPIQPYFTDHHENKAGGTRVIKSPLHGKISQILVEPGKEIKKGDFLFSLDAMKIENKITSPYDGCLKKIMVKAGDQVQINQIIMIIDESIIINSVINYK